MLIIDNQIILVQNLLLYKSNALGRDIIVFTRSQVI